MLILLGYPLTHLDDYNAELEKYHGCSLPGSTHMGLLIPVLKNHWDNELRRELSNKRIAMVFDGASVDGDLVAVLFRYVHDGKLLQKLMKLKHANCSVNNKQYDFFCFVFLLTC
jgi:hypothetical protein